MVKIGVIDCGISNLASVVNAFKFLSIDVEVVGCNKKLEWFTHLILPGVGTFSQGMRNLRERGFDFESATLVFESPPLKKEDLRKSYGERRIVAIGAADGLHRGRGPSQGGGDDDRGPLAPQVGARQVARVAARAGRHIGRPVQHDGGALALENAQDDSSVASGSVVPTMVHRSGQSFRSKDPIYEPSTRTSPA